MASERPQLSGMVGLARQLVAFDEQLSDEFAEHLTARADALQAQPGRDALSAIDRTRRFRTLAELIQRERAVVGSQNVV